MEPVDNSSESTPHKSGSRIFIIIAIVIVLSIAAFLILRPNPSGIPPGGSPASPASTR